MRKGIVFRSLLWKDENWMVGRSVYLMEINVLNAGRGNDELVKIERKMFPEIENESTGSCRVRKENKNFLRTNSVVRKVHILTS